MNKQILCTDCFKSLGVPSRMAIFTFLKNHDDASVGEVVDFVKLTQPTVSYHLLQMKQNGILKSYKNGKTVKYSLNGDCPHSCQECILSRVKLPFSNTENVNKSE